MCALRLNPDSLEIAEYKIKQEINKTNDTKG
jgi:hypothetical protein